MITGFAPIRVVGILHLSSRVVFTSPKQGYIFKPFTPFNSGFGDVLIQTNKKDLIDQYIVAELTSETQGHIFQYLKPVGDDDIEQIILKNVVTCHWSKKVERNLTPYLHTDLTPEREDFRYLDIISVDPEGCRDIDDAIHCTITDEYTELGIHIADVSSYIPQGSDLDIELSRRSESIYLANETLHMIPRIMSTDICSLIENVDRRAYSIIISWSGNFDLQKISCRFVKSMIHVKKNYTYDNLSLTIYAPMYDTGREIMRHLTNTVENYDTHKMIEQFMILANHVVARKIKEYGRGILRIHQMPRTDIETTNYADVNLQEMHKTMSMERAQYIRVQDTSTTLHAGLRIDPYTHFTSPIRRYADITVHRTLYNCTYEPNSEVVLNMNYYHKLYNDVMMLDDAITKLFPDRSMGVKVTDARIIYMKDAQIIVYIDEYDIKLRIKVIQDKLRGAIEVKTTDDKMEITTYDKYIELILYQRIKIKMHYLKRSVHKIASYIVEPDIQSLFNLQIDDDLL